MQHVNQDHVIAARRTGIVTLIKRPEQWSAHASIAAAGKNNLVHYHKSTSMKKIISAFLLTLFFVGGLVLSSSTTANAARPPRPCNEVCPPGWACHTKQSGEIVCICPKGCNIFDGF